MKIPSLAATTASTMKNWRRSRVELDRSLLESTNLVVMLHRWHRLCEVPYLIHIGYELPLLLEGRKKLARLSDTYPPMTFDG
jgi:hypothetical protein